MASLNDENTFCTIEQADDFLDGRDEWTDITNTEKTLALTNAALLLRMLYGDALEYCPDSNLMAATAIQALHLYIHADMFAELEQDGIASVKAKSAGSSSVTRSIGGFSLKKKLSPLARYYVELGNPHASRNSISLVRA